MSIRGKNGQTSSVGISQGIRVVAKPQKHTMMSQDFTISSEDTKSFFSTFGNI